MVRRRQIRETDRGWDQLRGRLAAEMRRAVVTVGVHADEEAVGDGTSMALIASVHEFGSEKAGVPERSFIRATVDDKREEYTTVLRRIAAAAMRGGSVRAGLHRLGLLVTADIQRTIRERIPPPLAEATIAKRLKRLGKSGQPKNDRFGGFTPLVDTGRLINSIRHEVSDE